MQLTPSAARSLRWSAYANFVLGLCVTCAALLWADTSAATIFGTVIGICVAIAAALSVRMPDLRLLNVALALLLCGTMWIVPQGSQANMWISTLAGMAILVTTIGVTTDPRGAGAPDAARYPDDEIGLGTSGPNLRLYPVVTHDSSSYTTSP